MPIRKVFAHGQSITAGAGVFPDAATGRYSARLAQRYGAVDDNRAYPGAVGFFNIDGTGGGQGWAKLMQDTIRPEQGPIPPEETLSIVDYGLNDLYYLGTTQQNIGLHAIRAMVARVRAEHVFEDDDTSISYSGPSWSQTTSNTINSGSTYHLSGAPNVGNKATISVPPAFPGGTIGLGFFSAFAASMTWSVKVDGVAWPDYNSGVASMIGHITGTVHRLTGLDPGAHTIEIEHKAGAGWFDYWQWENPDYPVLVTGQPRIPNIAGYGGGTVTYAEIAQWNNGVKAIRNEFDGRIAFVPQDEALNNNAALFAFDGVHPNEQGHLALANQAYDYARTIIPYESNLTVVPEPIRKGVWEFVLADKDFYPIGEVTNAAERKVSKPLSKLETASFRIRADHPLADYTLMDDPVFLKCYRDRQLQFFGPVITAEEVGDSGNSSISVNAVSIGWMLQKRLVGLSPTGTVYTNQDRAQIVRTMINNATFAVFGSTFNKTYIDTLSYIQAASKVTYTGGPYKTIFDCLTELSTSIDGFDWRILPVDNFVNGVVNGDKIGSFVASPVLGSLRDEAVFEYGTGRNNLSGYKRTRSREGQANFVYHVAETGADVPSVPVVASNDPDSLVEWQMLEDVAQAGLVDQTMRKTLTDEHIRVRKYPRQTIEVTPHIDPYEGFRSPRFPTDYDVGDSIRTRIAYDDVIRMDVNLRVWGVAFDINDLGLEQITLTLAEE